MERKITIEESVPYTEDYQNTPPQQGQQLRRGQGLGRAGRQIAQYRLQPAQGFPAGQPLAMLYHADGGAAHPAQCSQLPLGQAQLPPQLAQFDAIHRFRSFSVPDWGREVPPQPLG